MAKDEKIIGGILISFAGFYVLAQNFSGNLLAGLAILAIGFYLILSSLK